ncbi:isocitrate lyase/phosphoenolpyruvate mutase family protein [Microbulbifer sp. CnH-101-G]|uniref:isocitrate lyase/PEP mutase family protein n=1 Tax=Microbulbifer sp. CnH-101-G TaxID=3243393 RepID=UPI0040394AAF
MAVTHFEQFNALHQSNRPLILPNIWDAASAQLAQAAGAPAIATSSAAIAWSLGYADGGNLPISEHLKAVERILRASHVPVSIDIEDGYSTDPAQVAELVETLCDLGVVGINIEDGSGSPQLLEEKILAIRSTLTARKTRPLFINARTDVYLNGAENSKEALKEVIQRLARYQNAGASGGFIPGLISPMDARQLTKEISMPLNLMLLPGMEKPAQLWKAGIRRLSWGPALFQSSYALFSNGVTNLLSDQNPADIFDHRLTYQYLNNLAINLE